MEDDLCEIKCIKCGKSTFEFSYNLLEKSKKMHFYCEYCDASTSVFINKEKDLEIIRRGF